MNPTSLPSNPRLNKAALRGTRYFATPVNSLMLCLLLWASGCLSSSAADGAGDSVAAFRQLVYPERLQAATARDDRQQCASRWGSPVAYYLSGDVNDSRQHLVNEIMAQFDARLPIEINPGAPGSAPSGLVFRFTPTSVSAGARYKFQCSASRQTSFHCEIQTATVTLPTGLEEEALRYCLWHETLHAFGLRGHLRGVDSIMDPRSERTEPADSDWYFLELLYRPELLALPIETFLARSGEMIAADSLRPALSPGEPAGSP